MKNIILNEICQVLEQFMSWLLQARLDAGYAMQGDFVKALADNGLVKSQNAVSTWETRGRLPTGIVGSADQLQILADTLKMTPVELLRISGHEIDVLTLNGQQLSRHIQDFLQEALRCTPEQLEAFLPKFTDMLQYVRTTSNYDNS
jgi:hypothetical protein